MDSRFSILRRPYHLYKERKHRWIISFSIAAFAWFFLFVFGVFDFDYFDPFKRLYITGIYAFASWLALILNFFVIQVFLIRRLTLGNSILLSFSFMFTIGLANFILTTLVYQWEPFSMMVFLKNQLFTLALGLIIAPFCILAHFSYLLRKQSRTGSKSTIFITDTSVILESEYQKGNLELDLKDLLFMQSADNYIDVYYLEGDVIRHRLLRSTLSAIEKKLDHPGMVRCHRSYIVNLMHINSNRRHMNSLKLEHNEKKFTIPISRKYKEHVYSVLDRLV